MNAAHAYARTRNETASKERLMVLLFEKALAHMRAGAVALDEGRPTEAIGVLGKATDIVTELSATLDVNAVPELGAQLKELYLFVSTRLLKAMTARDSSAAREAERVFAPIADAFGQAVAAMMGAAAGGTR